MTAMFDISVLDALVSKASPAVVDPAVDASVAFDIHPAPPIGPYYYFKNPCSSSQRCRWQRQGLGSSRCWHPPDRQRLRE
jgi:hypothetical protein